jgi:hypothetical protein
VLSCVGSGLATGRLLVQGVLPIYIYKSETGFVPLCVCCYATAAGAFSFWSVLGLFVYWFELEQWGGIYFGVRSEVVFSLGSVPRSLLASGVVTGREGSLLL